MFYMGSVSDQTDPEITPHFILKKFSIPPYVHVSAAASVHKTLEESDRPRCGRIRECENCQKSMSSETHFVERLVLRNFVTICYHRTIDDATSV